VVLFLASIGDFLPPAVARDIAFFSAATTVLLRLALDFEVTALEALGGFDFLAAGAALFRFESAIESTHHTGPMGRRRICSEYYPV
jgi:hypothetical protein